MMRKIVVLVAVLALAGCQSNDAPDSNPALTKRQADSALGASGLPGARGITGAMSAADSAAARAARANSAAYEP